MVKFPFPYIVLIQIDQIDPADADLRLVENFHGPADVHRLIFLGAGGQGGEIEVPFIFIFMH